MSNIWRIICVLLIAVIHRGDAGCFGSSFEATEEERLVECMELKLLGPKVLPGGPKPIVVKCEVPLVSLLDYNDMDNTIEVQLAMRYIWEDPMYKWEPEQFGGFKYLVLPSYRVWKPVPSIIMNRNENRQYMEMMKSRIWYNGTIEWYIFIHTTTICETDFSDFPYDTQVCDLRLYHSPYTAGDLNVTIEDVFEVEVLTASWTERDTYIAHETYYVDSHDGEIEEHVNFAFTFILDRKSIFYNYLLVCPSICVLIFVLFLFMVPIQSNQRFTMASFLFMSTISLYLSAQHMLPPGIGKVPFIVKYITLDFVLILFAFVLSTITYHIYHHDTKQQLPPLLKQIFLNPALKKLARISPPLSISQSSSENLSSDNQGSAVHASRASSPGEQIDRTLDDFQKYLSSVLEKEFLKGSTFEMLIASEWKQMALVLERLCLIILSCICIITTFVMFSNKFHAPKVVERFL